MSGLWAELDVEHLVEELEALGRREQKELVKLFADTFDSFTQMPVSTRAKNQKLGEYDRQLPGQDPGLSGRYTQFAAFAPGYSMVQKYYRRARRGVAKETQMPVESFPSECLWAIEPVLDPNVVI